MKFIKTMFLAATICVAALTVGAQTASSINFIGLDGGNDSGVVPQGGTSGLIIANNSTNGFGSNNLVYVKGGFTGFVGMSYTDAVVNIAYTSNTNGILPLYSTNAAGISDVILYANRDGSIPLLACQVDTVGYTNNFTNVLTLRFAQVLPNGQASTSPQGQFVFSFNENGLNHVAISTNLNTTAGTSWVQGAHRLRLTTVESAGSAQVNTVAPVGGSIVGIWLKGFKPGLN